MKAFPALSHDSYMYISQLFPQLRKSNGSFNRTKDEVENKVENDFTLPKVKLSEHMKDI